MSKFQKADAGWVAIERHPEFGAEAHQVKFFEVDEGGVAPLVKDADGVFQPGRHTVDVVRATPMDAVRITAMYELLELAGRATTQRQMDSIAEAQALIMRGPGG
ncbi:hypothetical protein QBA37_25830 [Streptomyces silvae]|uniref:Uncharacterized protein n=1 Tax=Streptomyces silvae TaxID=2803812 RepID=A0ABU8A8A5_9ACTN